MGAVEGCFLLPVQELVETPSSPAPERRCFVPPKISSELPLGGATREDV